MMRWKDEQTVKLFDVSSRGGRDKISLKRRTLIIHARAPAIIRKIYIKYSPRNTVDVFARKVRGPRALFFSFFYPCRAISGVTGETQL